MKISIFLVTIAVLVAGGTVAQGPVHADGPCEDDCQQQFNSCELSATNAYNTCAYNADSALNLCQSFADWDFDDCVEESCGGYTWTACVDMCEGRRIAAYSQCQDNYQTAMNQCQDQEDGADAVCNSNLANCLDNCGGR